jgi:chemotaxis protein MotB
MARMARFIGAALVGLALTGCVSQEKYNALKLDRDAKAEEAAKAQSDAQSARAEADVLKNQLASLNANGQGAQGLMANQANQIATLQAQLEEMNRRYAEAMNRPGGAIALNPQLTNELSAFAAQNPDLVDFDAARGIVKFKSDVTFASGDATVTSKAKEVIGRFAQILNSPSASGYELMVAGHTDNTRVVNPNTLRAGHLDNWYLSAHRAITVSKELFAHAINQQRVGVLGYADQRPIASNASSSGQAQNRRVEVLILPTTIHGGAAPVASGSRTTPLRSSNKQPMNKDAAVKIESAPVLNK